jgi:hypothetical protein
VDNGGDTYSDEIIETNGIDNIGEGRNSNGKKPWKQPTLIMEREETLVN